MSSGKQSFQIICIFLFTAQLLCYCCSCYYVFFFTVISIWFQWPQKQFKSFQNSNDFFFAFLFICCNQTFINRFSILINLCNTSNEMDIIHFFDINENVDRNTYFFDARIYILNNLFICYGCCCSLLLNYFVRNT